MKLSKQIHASVMGDAAGGTVVVCLPTLKSRGTSYVLVSPNFYHIIYFDWLVPLHTHHRYSAPSIGAYIHTHMHTSIYLHR